MLIILLIGLFFADLIIGKTDISISEILSTFAGKTDNTNYLIIRELRFPRVLGAIFIGGGLAISGLLLQNLFRNPLAGPYILGVSSGSALGVSILILGADFLPFLKVGSFSLALAGFIGAILVLGLVLLFFWHFSDVMTVLIFGVLLGGVINALINLLQYLSNSNLLKKYIIWTMGSLEMIDNERVMILGAGVLVVLLFSWLINSSLDLVYLGESSVSTGLNYRLMSIIIMIEAGLLSGLITSYAGPIAFIGIIVPHLTRMFLQTSLHRWLLPGVFLMGAILLLIADILIRLPFWTGILPINTVTSLLGIPVIFYILLANRKVVI